MVHQTTNIITLTPAAAPPEALSGLIERVTFFNENGFAVLKVIAKGHRDLVTVLDSLPSVSAGEWFTAEGCWVRDSEFGRQFHSERLNSTAPNDEGRHRKISRQRHGQRHRPHPLRQAGEICLE